MPDPTIICPNCKTEIKLTESLAAPLVASLRHDYDQRLAQKDVEAATALTAQRATIAAEESKKARQAVESDLTKSARDLADLQSVIAAKDTKLVEAQKAQADILRERRELADAKRELDLTLEKRVQESLSTVRAAARQEADEAAHLKLAEKEQVIEAQKRQLAEAQRKLEQGSQQLQGEVQELALESILRAKFPHDSIEPVPKGEYGGDTLQRVRTPAGQSCGTILWESKNTKNWSDPWLTKLREDQRAAKAEIAILVTQTLPKGVEVSDLIDGIWVTTPRLFMPIAIALRHSLVELAAARQAGEGQQTKMELVYQYLTGPRFRQRIQAIVERFSEMQEDLESERKALTTRWAKRAKQIEAVIEATAGMYGDLQGIAGRTLQEIEGLDLRLPEGGDEQRAT